MTYIDEELTLINANPLCGASTTSEVAHSTPVDVSASARCFGFARSVHMDAEAFGVLVTRRPAAQAAELRPYERARLLAALASLAEYVGQCDEEPRQVEHWVISSDSRDNLPRCLWIQLEVTPVGYLVTLTRH